MKFHVVSRLGIKSDSKFAVLCIISSLLFCATRDAYSFKISISSLSSLKAYIPISINPLLSTQSVASSKNPSSSSSQKDLSESDNPINSPDGENGNNKPQKMIRGEIRMEIPASYFDVKSYIPDIKLISEDPNRVKFLLFSNAKNLNESETLKYEDLESIKSSKYDPKKPVKFLVHGFQNNVNSTFPQNVKNAYLSKNLDYNVIVVDWGDLAIPNAPFVAPIFYPIVARNVWKVGQRLGDFISWLKKENLMNVEEVHIIGFSLGSHVSGNAASIVQKKINITIARVTALDPAGPEFYTGVFARKLTLSDAKFVDAYHTNAGQLGMWTNIGDVDYYVNGGSGPQPGCIGVDSIHAMVQSVTTTVSGTCSHIRATEIYAKTIMDDSDKSKRFCFCESLIFYNLNTCGCKRKIGFGEYSAPGYNYT